MNKKLTLMLGVFVFSICLTSNLLAEQGSFEYAFGGTHDYKTIKTNLGTSSGGGLVGTITITKSSGDLFPIGSSGVTECLVMINRENGTVVDLKSPCQTTFTLSKSIMYMTATRKKGTTTQGGGGIGSQEITGGIQGL